MKDKYIHCVFVFASCLYTLPKKLLSFICCHKIKDKYRFFFLLNTVKSDKLDNSWLNNSIIIYICYFSYYIKFERKVHA